MIINDLGFPFTSSGGDRQYSSADWREFFDKLLEGGVIGDVGNELSVEPQAVPSKSIYVDTGAVFIKGAMRVVETTTTLSLSDNTSGNPRIDRIVARLNYTDKKIEFAVIEGVPGSSPSAPSLTRDDTKWEFSLSQIAVANGYSAITSGEIIDERSDEEICGFFRYRAKPAWYPEGHVIEDAYMYTLFKDQLTAGEIADIEANSSLMAIINNSKIVEIIETINKNQYDAYLQTLELYYTGHFSGPAIDGYTGMTFDGFADTNRVDTENTDANIDTSLKLVRADNSNTIDIHPTSVTNSTQSGWTDDFDFSSLSNTIDNAIGDESSYASYAAPDDGDDHYAVIAADFGQVYSMTEVLLRLWRYYSVYTGSYAELVKIAVSEDNVNWTEIAVGVDTPKSNDADKSMTVSFGSTTSVRYVKLHIKAHNSSSSSNDMNVQIGDIAAKTIAYADGDLISTEKILDEAIEEGTLYLSVKETDTEKITPYISLDGGASYLSPDYVSSKTDPLDADYMEKIYSLDALSLPGTNLVIKAVIEGENAETAELKRYGFLWM